MNQRRFCSLALALGLMAGVGSLALSARAQETAQPDPNLVVAKLNGEDITRQDVVDSAQNLPPEIQANLDQLFPQLLDRLVFLKLVAGQGRADGLAEDPEVKELMRQYEDNAIREIFFQRAIMAKVTDEAIKARYDEEVKNFPEEREVRASHILVKTEEEAQAIIEQLKGGGDFAAIAKEKSTDTASGKNGGDLNWFTKEIMVPEFADAAFAMKKGEVSQSPVKSQFGFHIIKLDDERMKAPPSFEQRRDDIRVQLTEELRQQVAKDLKDKAQLEIIDPSGGAKAAQ
ncbi:peptidyl-prolyl cis-trans isomerase C [Dongia mobilis]|uniref:Parvulin-like PPIase n=1 Tax=Dongia mobilis TaxID=578943 RepID=A0A4R6WRR2_9PROT|nr:peptidylprolyl isomerase [Dongia mobilis]TDQ84196.1 peptidyl-prolyl cis-trans isomerase C [Dongia mobilis]